MAAVTFYDGILIVFILVDNSHSDNFFIFKNTSIQGQKVLNPFFCSSNCLVKLAAIYTFFIQFTQSAMFEKNSEFRLPTFQINFIIIDQIYLHY